MSNTVRILLAPLLCCGWLCSVVAISRAADPITMGSLRAQLRIITRGLGGPVQLTPIDLAPLPDRSGRMIVATLGGLVRLINARGSLLDSEAFPYLNTNAFLPPSDPNLRVSAIFHPDFAHIGKAGYGKLYTLATTPPSSSLADFPLAVPQHEDVLVEWSTNDIASNAPTWSFRKVIRFDQISPLHNVWDLAFDQAGFLYISSGDGGIPEQAQQLNDFHGKLFRIDPLDPSDPIHDIDPTSRNRGTVSANGEYFVPNNNPFVATLYALPEIYAYGFRSPYRMNFDQQTGDLYLADVGAATLEEVDRVVAGRNYGWPVFEGTMCYENCLGDFTDPIFEYSHADGFTVIGGFVYHGSAIPELQGKYIFGEFGRHASPKQVDNVARMFYGELNIGIIFELQLEGAMLSERFLLSIGEDLQGELYAVAGEDPEFNPGVDGMILKLEPAKPDPVEVSDLEATFKENSVQLTWAMSFDSPFELQGVQVQRSTDVNGPYSLRTPTPLLPARRMSFVDTDIEGSQEYWYRLLLLLQDVSLALAGPVQVTARGGPGPLRLEVTSGLSGAESIDIRYRIHRMTRSVGLDVYDVRGRHIRSLQHGFQSPGDYVRTWRRSDDQGHSVARGIYLVRLRAGGQSAVRKLVLVR